MTNSSLPNRFVDFLRKFNAALQSPLQTETTNWLPALARVSFAVHRYTLARTWLTRIDRSMP